jgi:cytidyltransferase-like protein
MASRTVYTVGCFDQFHRGHEIILKKMKERGDKLVAGVHDDTSLEKLKNLKPEEHDPHYVRMANAKKLADVVYIIPDTDPTECLRNIVDANANMENSLYVRGDDMKNFPGKQLIEKIMPIEYLPYTQGISSTQIRKERR